MSMVGSVRARRGWLALGLMASLASAVALCCCRHDTSQLPNHPLASAVPLPAPIHPTAVPTVSATERGIDITADVDSAKQLVSVKVCPRGMLLKQLSAPMDEAVPLLRDVRIGTTPAVLQDDAIALGDLPRGKCVSYEVAFAAALDGRGMDARQSGDDLLLSPDLWLWTPEPRPSDAPVTIQFVLPAGWTAAVPWPQLPDGRYHVPESAFVWRTQAAFGTLARRVFHTGGADVSAYVLGAGWGARQDAVLSWVGGSAAAVTALFGRFPTERAQALLVTTPAGGSTFGMAMHGGGMSTYVLLPEDIDIADVDARWTVVHELLHFSLPPVINRDAWLHEGITTYLTTKARARAGIIDASFAWWELLDGFERGRNRGTGRTLREESAAMRETHQYWRVYWSGAAMALSMDMQLSESGSSLEQVLLDLAAKQIDASHRWEGLEVLKLLDQACGRSIATETCLPYLDKPDFPDTDALARQLGVRIVRKHHAAFDEQAPKAKLRQRLMAPRG